MAPTFLFEIPVQLQSAVASGLYKQIGALITDPASGRIVAHLQQTGAARDLALSMIQNGPSVLSALSSPLSLLGTAVTYTQNRAILQGLETVRLMQMGGLALTGLDIGISLAGFAIVQARLKEVSRGLAEVKDQLTHMAGRIEDLFDDKVRGELSELGAACHQVDDAWTLNDPVPAWGAAVEGLYRLEETFFDRAEQTMARGGIQALEAAERFMEAALLASATLVSVRVACRELDAARKAADRSSARLQRLTSGVGLRQILATAVSREGLLSLAGRVDALERLQPQAAGQVKRVRFREEAAASSGLALGRLTAAGVDGRAYLQRMREEKDAAFAVVLPELTSV